jgi:hypothetical protein
MRKMDKSFFDRAKESTSFNPAESRKFGMIQGRMPAAEVLAWERVFKNIDK